MKSKLKGTVDLSVYLDKADLSYIPSEADVDDSVRKALTKGKLTLTEMDAGAEIRSGDVVLLHTKSTLPKFNKEHVSVTVGTGLYDKGLEQAIEGLKTGDHIDITVQETPVCAEVLQIRRKKAPELSDALAEEQKIEGVHTLAEYRNYYRGQIMDSAIGRAMYEIMNEVMADYPLERADEEDIAVLGQLERDFFIELFLKEEGIDLRKEIPQGWKDDFHINTLDEFIAARKEWYKTKLHQCLLLLDILDLPCEGEYDPLLHYDAYSKMQALMMKKLETELTRRKNEHG